MRETTEAVVERTNVARDKQVVPLYDTTDYAENLNIGQYLQTRPAGNCSGMFCTPCGEVVRPTNSTNGRLLRRKIPRSKIRPIEEMTIFDTEGCSGIDVKVPSTENPEMLVWASACTNEVQNCRQIASTNTVVLTENPHNETPETGQLVAKGVTWKAEGDLELEPQPFQKKNIV